MHDQITSQEREGGGYSADQYPYVVEVSASKTRSLEGAACQVANMIPTKSESLFRNTLSLSTSAVDWMRLLLKQ